ncbi:MAG: ABC transporter permease [Gemmatimonadota bacterium]
MSTFLHDIKSARRLLTRSPGFTIIAVVTLALGIGLNTAVFSAIDALLLRPLAGVRAPERLVQAFRVWPGIEYGSWGPLHMADVRERTRDVFEDMAIWNITPLNIAADGQTQRVFGTMVSANFFSVLGAQPLRGRTFLPVEDRNPGANPVVILSEATWRGMFGSDPSILGRKITINGAPYEVVGVMPVEFRGPIPVVAPAMWVPLSQIAQIDPANAAALTERTNNFMSVIARLRDGVTAEQATAQLAAVQRQLIADIPDEYEGSSFVLVRQDEAGIHPSMRGAQVGLSVVVMAVVVMLLLIACVNVANLFLARARDRWREMAVRLSLGARRAVIVRQLLTESLVFALVAGMAGVVVAGWAISLLNRIQLPFDVSFTPDLRLSIPVLVFTLVVTAVTGVLFGLAPALQATRPALIPALKGEAPAGDSRSRASRSLVVVQMALSMLLLVSAGLFLRALRSATDIDRGFAGGNVLLADLQPQLQGYTRARADQFYGTLVQRLREIPGVEAVSYNENLPLGLGGSQSGVQIAGYTPAENEQMSIDYDVVSPDYFDALGIGVIKGRGFVATDDSTSQRVMVVNARFAERFWPGQDAVGRTVRARGADHVVIGVVPTGKYRSLGEPPRAYAYYAKAQGRYLDATLQIRTRGDPTLVTAALRAEVAALDPTLPVSNVRTLANHLGLSLLPARLAGGALGVFGLLGLILASVGIYGVMSYSVAQRTREIGIRMAIGAERGRVVGLVMRQGLTLVGLGAGIGLLLSFGAAQLLGSMLYGGNPLDPVTFVGVPLLLTGVAALAILVPARRAAGVDPVRAMRTE